MSEELLGGDLLTEEHLEDVAPHVQVEAEQLAWAVAASGWM